MRIPFTAKVSATRMEQVGVPAGRFSQHHGELKRPSPRRQVNAVEETVTSAYPVTTPRTSSSCALSSKPPRKEANS